jgi:UDP-glucose 6-dehydrogenase
MSRGLRLTVLGAGYLGITHATCMAGLGFDVLAWTPTGTGSTG